MFSLSFTLILVLLDLFFCYLKNFPSFLNYFLFADSIFRLTYSTSLSLEFSDVCPKSQFLWTFYISVRFMQILYISYLFCTILDFVFVHFIFFVPFILFLTISYFSLHFIHFWTFSIFCIFINFIFSHHLLWKSSLKFF